MRAENDHPFASIHIRPSAHARTLHEKVDPPQLPRAKMGPAPRVARAAPARPPTTAAAARAAPYASAARRRRHRRRRLRRRRPPWRVASRWAGGTRRCAWT